MKKLGFLLFPIVAIFFATTGYSDDQSSDINPISEQIAKRCDQCEPCCEPCPPPCPPCKECEICPPCEPCNCCDEVPSTGIPKNCAYNAPARIDPACGWKVWLDGSFIYWQAKEINIAIATHVVTSNPNTAIDKVTYATPIIQSFDFHPGFKIGAGMSFKRDDWALYGEYTRFKADESAGYDVGINFQFQENYLLSTPLNLNSNFVFKSVKSKWHLSFDMLDLELSRPFYVGQKVVFEPHFGLNGGWIDQRFNLSGVAQFSSVKDNDFNILANFKQDSWLIGPRAGLDSKWMISCYLRVFANVAASLYYQKFEIKNNSSRFDIFPGILNGTEQNFVKYEISRIIPSAELCLGLGYGKYFFDNQWYFDLCAGYNFIYFWHQGQFVNADSPLNYTAQGNPPQGVTVSASPADLLIQGLTITARVDF